MDDDATGSSRDARDGGLNPEVSIVLLCYDGERYLDEVLQAIFGQKTSVRFEVLAIDSGSTDRTLEILSQYPVTIHVIPNEEFGHGRTRNLGARLSTGGFVMFLTQDATPANKTWLDNLLRPLKEDPQVAGAYSRQLPRADCNPIERRDIEKGAGPLSMVKRVDFEDPYQKRNYLLNIHEFMLFSNVSSCVRKDVLLRLPFNEHLPMVEDQEWCQRALENGYTIIYEANSAVYHSHNHTLHQIYTRHGEYGTAFREFTDLSTSWARVLFYVVRESLADASFVLSKPEGWLWKVRWIAKAPFVRFAMRCDLARGLAGRTGADWSS